MHDTKERLALFWVFALLNYLYADCTALFAIVGSPNLSDAHIFHRGACASERRCGSDPPQRICEGSRHFPKSPLRHAHPKERARESFANSRDSSTVAVRIFATWHRLWQENTKKGSSERTPSP
jgi:hypothetical protein